MAPAIRSILSGHQAQPHLSINEKNIKPPTFSRSSLSNIFTYFMKHGLLEKSPVI